MTAHEWMLKTIKDIEARRKAKEEGRKQADLHVFLNRERIQKRIQYGRR